MTGFSIRVEGLETVTANLNKRIGQVKDGTMAGLLAGGLKVQRLSQERVPVKFGNLKASAYTRKAIEEGLMAAEVGYTAAYAIFVHENLEMKLKGEPRPDGPGEYWGPNGQNKFLESAVRELEDEIVRTVAAYARVK